MHRAGPCSSGARKDDLTVILPQAPADGEAVAVTVEYAGNPVGEELEPHGPARDRTLVSADGPDRSGDVRRHLPLARGLRPRGERPPGGRRAGGGRHALGAARPGHPQPGVLVRDRALRPPDRPGGAHPGDVRLRPRRQLDQPWRPAGGDDGRHRRARLLRGDLRPLPAGRADGLHRAPRDFPGAARVRHDLRPLPVQGPRDLEPVLRSEGPPAGDRP